MRPSSFFKPIIKNKWLLSLSVAILSIAISQLFINAIYVSDDDVLYLLTFSGSLGNAPTHLIGIEHIWHPVYGWIVKTLFTHFPSLNWYSFFLIGFHIAGLSAAFYYLLHQFTPVVTAVCYGVLFFIFEVRLLQNLDFTKSAMMCALGGCLLLSHAPPTKKRRLAGTALLFFALLLRFHISILIVVLFSPLLFLPLSFDRIRKIGLCLLTAGVGWFVFHQAQREFYKKEIPAWQEKAEFRETFFYLVNHARDRQKEKDVIQSEAGLQLFRRGFFYDSAYFNANLFRSIAKATTTSRGLFSPSSRPVLYWAFMEHKLYLSLLLFTAILLYIVNRKQSRRLFYLLLPAAIWLYLFTYLKITPAIYFALFLAGFFYLLGGLAGVEYHQIRRFKWLVAVGLVLLFFWSGRLVVQLNKSNKERRLEFDCLANALKTNRSQLFVATDFGVVLTHLPVWKSPKDYQVDNLLYYQRHLIDDPRRILRQHFVPEPFPAWLMNEKVRLLGPPLHLLPDYCEKQYGVAIELVNDTTSGCNDIYKVTPSK